MAPCFILYRHGQNANFHSRQRAFDECAFCYCCCIFNCSHERHMHLHTHTHTTHLRNQTNMQLFNLSRQSVYVELFQFSCRACELKEEEKKLHGINTKRPSEFNKIKSYLFYHLISFFFSTLSVSLSFSVAIVFPLCIKYIV